jgi:two-component system chemotaxis response regulator CheY
MPKLSGLDLLRNIKADDSLKHIDVIILSTSSSQSHIDSCIGSGASGYYVKPSRTQGIIDIAKEILLKVKSLGKEQVA